MLVQEGDRGTDFYVQLQRIEYQCARVTENPNFDLNSESTRSLMKEKSMELLTAIVKFFNSALLYYSNNFFGRF